MDNNHISIIGLGLIGGSLARALREKLNDCDITAVNRSKEPLNQAIADGTVDRGFKAPNEYVYNSDIIFICTPVKKTLEYIETLADKVSAQCILTDVGSTKAEIIDFVNNMRNPPCFIGGHPMAGNEKSGYRESVSHLFENAYYILTPSRTTTESSIEIMTEIVSSIGAIPVTMDSHEHDRITGSISHVPHIIAAALVNLVNQSDTPDATMQKLAAGGFKDITRIASSSPQMWENIISSNNGPVCDILQKYIDILKRFSDTVKNYDSKTIFNFFDTARQYRNCLSSHKKGLIDPFCEIVVDIVDKPGMLGNIATLLGDGGINIKNMNISNNRENQKGCLTITLPDTRSADTAFQLLEEKGYSVYREV
jgi:prephenate dehydrogenase